ncbi:Metal dependent phosphohydrolase (modular protein) [Candidatus Bipolaricaulis anaerobius]|uniref:Metal dependent phosphohydrolase (Modular protein) n=1 Tax=Candidatus Bipolaricaulis anaerobius TaxID=2026885 RepID=A0A2X3MLB6_9BACT|nr:HD domain-containing phosphohydrolase [Candidatus Bipolaricaulis anaerobius]SQD92935.1 Metal dependent phosphohydrolase (modular protein) [Candidatus Bipolaricaulis anaerobius]
MAAGLVCCVFYLSQIKLTSEFALTWILLVVVDFLAEIYEVELIPERRTSVAVSVGAAAVFIGGAPLGIATLCVGSLAAEVLLRWNKLARGPGKFFTFVGFNLGQLMISVTAAGLVLEAMGGAPPPYASGTDFIPLVVAFLTYDIVNASLVAMILHLTEGVRFTYLLRFDLRHLHVQFLTLGVLAILMAIVYPLSPWYVLLVGSPLMVVQISIRSYARLRQQAKEAFERITRIVGERDFYTGTHSANVAELAVKLTRKLRLPDEVVDQVEAAARVHDLGKIAIPDSILLKPGKLTAEEWALVKRHPVVGAELLQGLEIYEEIADVVRHEHEHWDGGGYPDGLSGEKIPLGSRIIAVADVWSALTTDRPYRPAYTADEARTILKAMAEKELDPKLVDLFLTVVN